MIKYVKLDIDDLYEIVLEHYQELFKCDYSKGVFLGNPECDLRFVAAFSNHNDSEINNVDLESIDEKIGFNGDHAFLKKNPDFYIK